MARLRLRRCSTSCTPSTSAASHRSVEHHNVRTIGQVYSLGSSRRLTPLRRTSRDRPIVARHRLRDLLPQLGLGRARPQTQGVHHDLGPPSRVGDSLLAHALAPAPYRHTAAPDTD